MIHEVIVKKAAAREAAINELISQAEINGTETDRGYNMLHYDFNLAPETTNRKQLLDIGIKMPNIDKIPEDTLLDLLRIVTEGLAMYGIFLLHTNHLTDAEFYEKLCQIVDEGVKEVVGGDSGMHEYIDLVGGSPKDRNKFYGDNSSLRRSLFKSNRDSSLPKPKDMNSKMHVSFEL